MGGCIGVTIRVSKNEYRMCRWTNPVPHLINNPTFCEKPQLGDYLREWTQMREDWKNAREDESRCMFPMTPVYAPYPYLAPMEYGLIVIDFQTDQILHLQTYCAIGEIHHFGKTLIPDHDPEDHRLQAWAKRNRIKGYTDGTTLSYMPLPDSDTINGNTTKAVKQVLRDAKGPMVRFELNMDPWTIIKFEQSREGLTAFRQHLTELQFKLSPTELLMWEEYADHHFPVILPVKGSKSHARSTAHPRGTGNTRKPKSRR